MRIRTLGMGGLLSTIVCMGCLAGISPLFQEDTPLSANDAERALEMAFAQHQIPVLERSPDGRVRSGPFNPEEAWGGLAMDRITCGADQLADRRSYRLPEEFEVMARIRTRHQAGTRVDLDGHGQTHTNGEKTPCTLTRSFASSILAAIPGNYRGRGGERSGKHMFFHLFSPRL